MSEILNFLGTPCGWVVANHSPTGSWSGWADWLAVDLKNIQRRRTRRIATIHVLKGLKSVQGNLLLEYINREEQNLQDYPAFLCPCVEGYGPKRALHVYRHLFLAYSARLYVSGAYISEMSTPLHMNMEPQNHWVGIRKMVFHRSFFSGSMWSVCGTKSPADL